MDEAIIQSAGSYEVTAVDVLMLWSSLQQTCYVSKNGTECAVFIH